MRPRHLHPSTDFGHTHIVSARLCVVDSPAHLSTVLDANSIHPPVRATNPHVDIAVYEGAERRIVFAANTTDEEQHYALTLPGARTLRGLWQPGTLDGLGVFTDMLAGRHIHVWEVR